MPEIEARYEHRVLQRVRTFVNPENSIYTTPLNSPAHGVGLTYVQELFSEEITLTLEMPGLPDDNQWVNIRLDPRAAYLLAHQLMEQVKVSGWWNE